MAKNIINLLEVLQENSNQRLSQSIVHGFKIPIQQDGGNPIQLAKPFQIANANWAHKPRMDVASLAQKENCQIKRKIMTLTAGQENNFTFNLNTSLLGGQSYPILTAVLGTAAGIASFGAGLLFSAATTAISLSQTSRRVLARAGDEIWQVEEIGKVANTGIFDSSNSPYKAIHINSYFLFDPFRHNQHTVGKGWLIHEERNSLVLD